MNKAVLACGKAGKTVKKYGIPAEIAVFSRKRSHNRGAVKAVGVGFGKAAVVFAVNFCNIAQLVEQHHVRVAEILRVRLKLLGVVIGVDIRRLEH